MRLGFWNRMALVVSGLVTVVLPSWRVFSFDQQNRAAIKAGYDACIRAPSLTSITSPKRLTASPIISPSLALQG